MTNTADWAIRLIIRDEAVHGYYIGYKFQRGRALADDVTRAEPGDYTYERYCSSSNDNEVEYTRPYDEVGQPRTSRSSCATTRQQGADEPSASVPRDGIT